MVRGGMRGRGGGHQRGGGPPGGRPFFIPHVPFDPVLAEPCFPPVKSQPQEQEEALQTVIQYSQTKHQKGNCSETYSILLTFRNLIMFHSTDNLTSE